MKRIIANVAAMCCLVPFVDASAQEREGVETNRIEEAGKACYWSQYNGASLSLSRIS